MKDRQTGCVDGTECGRRETRRHERRIRSFINRGGVDEEKCMKDDSQKRENRAIAENASTCGKMREDPSDFGGENVECVQQREV